MRFAIPVAHSWGSLLGGAGWQQSIGSIAVPGAARSWQQLLPPRGKQNPTAEPHCSPPPCPSASCAARTPRLHGRLQEGLCCSPPPSSALKANLCSCGALAASRLSASQMERHGGSPPFPARLLQAAPPHLEVSRWSCARRSGLTVTGWSSALQPMLGQSFSSPAPVPVAGLRGCPRVPPPIQQHLRRHRVLPAAWCLAEPFSAGTQPVLEEVGSGERWGGGCSLPIRLFKGSEWAGEVPAASPGCQPFPSSEFMVSAAWRPGTGAVMLSG